MIDAYYFPHDINASNDPKLLALRVKLGWAGVGLYWAILEILREMPGYRYAMNNGYLSEIEMRLSTPQATLQAWLDEALEVGLIAKISDGDRQFFASRSLIDRMAKIDAARKALSDAGRKGGLASSQAKAGLIARLKHKRKENKRKEKDTSTTESAVAKVSDPHIATFDELWNQYPNRDGKKEAFRHYCASVNTPQDYLDIVKALKNYKDSREVARGFIKKGATWFNNWRDWVNPPTDGS